MSTDLLLEKTPSTPEAVAAASDFVTLEDYFAIAAESECRVEYIDGELFFMDGVTLFHSSIQINITGFLYNQLDATDYGIHSSNVSVHVAPSAYIFPDLCIVRGAGQVARRGTALLNPVLVVEVLSKSTARKDRGIKLQRYQAISSLEHVLIIEQDFVAVEHHRRDRGNWKLATYTSLDNSVPLDSLDASLSLAQIYRGIDFAQG